MVGRNKVLSKRYSAQRLNNDDNLGINEDNADHFKSQEEKPNGLGPDNYHGLVSRKSEAQKKFFSRNETVGVESTLKTEVAAKISATLISLGNSDGDRKEVPKGVKINAKSFRKLNQNAGVFGPGNLMKFTESIKRTKSKDLESHINNINREKYLTEVRNK